MVIFSVNLPMIFIYKFCQNEILIQRSGEPREGEKFKNEVAFFIYFLYMIKYLLVLLI